MNFVVFSSIFVNALWRDINLYLLVSFCLCFWSFCMCPFDSMTLVTWGSLWILEYGRADLGWHIQCECCVVIGRQGQTDNAQLNRRYHFTHRLGAKVERLRGDPGNFTNRNIADTRSYIFTIAVRFYIHSGGELHMGAGGNQPQSLLTSFYNPFQTYYTWSFTNSLMYTRIYFILVLI